MASYRTNYFTNNPTQLKTNHPTAKATTAKSVNQKAGRTLKDIKTPKTKKMSADMAAWVKANRSKLPNPTKKQEALFKQYDALKKEGNLPSTSTVKSRPSPQAQPSTSTKTGGKSPVQRAVAATKSRVPQRFADGGKDGKYDKAVQNKEKAKSNFFRSSSGTRGENVKSNPKLKSQPKKPSRKDFPAGRAGSLRYAAAMTKHRSLLKRVEQYRPRLKTNRRGRSI